MTEPTSPVNDIADRGQEVANAAIRTWTDTVQSLADKLTSGQSQLPDLQGVVEQYFDLAEKTLTNQRAFARQWLSGTVQTSVPVTEQAHHATQSVSAHTPNAAEAVVDNATEAARVAVDKAATVAPTAGDTS
jgi:hypothetical protein